MASLDDAVGFQKKKFSARRFDRGAVVTDARHGGSAAQGSAQPGHDDILTVRLHRKKRIPTIETALKTACMIMGTKSEPLRS